MTGEIFRTASGALVETSTGGIPSRPGVVPPPTLASVSPTSGVDTGGTLLTLTGTGFSLATAVLLGGIAVGSFAIVNDTAITFTSPSHTDGAATIAVVTPSGTSGTVPYTYGPPSSGTVFTALQVRNGQTASRTAPPVTAGHTFAPAEIPAGSYPEMRPTGSGSPITDFQWDQISTRKDGSWYYAVASFKASGAFAAYKSAGDTISYDLVSKTGTPPYSTSTITPTTIAAASQIYVKLYGGDFTTEIGAGTYYYADLNYILANYVRDTWGTNPTGGWELIASGSVCNRYWAWMCARRKSDNAINKWLVIAMEVTVWATGEYTINPVVIQPWIYGAHPSGTLGPAVNAQPNVSVPAQPRYAGFYEIWDGKTNTLIGARGGLNDPTRVLTIPAANFDSTTATEPVLRFTTAMSNYGSGSSVRGGAMPQSTPWMFQAAAGGTLPSGIDPNWVYWAGYPAGNPLHTYIALERSFTPGFGDPFSATDPQWVSGHAYNRGDSVARNRVGYVYMTSGTSGSTGPVPNTIGVATANQFRTDGTATYVQASANWGSAGSGNVLAIPVCATFGQTAIDFKDENAQPYWYDPINHTAAPWMLPMPDFEYTTGRSKVVHPFQFRAPANLGMGEKYTPNEIFVDFGSDVWDVLRAPGDDYLDNRLGAWSQRNALRLYQLGDRDTAQDARAMNARFFEFQFWGWDHRTGRLPIINLGHNRAGSDYTGYAAGTVNSNLRWHTEASSSSGSPVPMGCGYTGTNINYYRHFPGWGSTYGQAVNGSHCPGVGTGDYIINGDYVALQSMQAVHFGTQSSQWGFDRNSPPGFSGLGGLTNHDAGQARAAGWDTVKQGYTLVLTPDWHLIKAYYKDNMTDMSTYFAGLKAYTDANVSPKMAQWGLVSLTTASIGGVNNLWNLSHMMEGMTYCAMVLTPDYPGFKQAVDNYLMNLARVYDPNNGGCLYYIGTAFIVYGVTGAASSLNDTFPQMAMNVNNCGDWNAGQWNTFAQVPGSSFVCPGIGAKAPGFICPGGGIHDPAQNILDGESVTEDHNFCTGFVQKDAANVAFQNIAPIAVAGSIPGTDPRFKVLYDAFRLRITQDGMIGPTMGNSFQYFYEPKA